MTRQRLREIWSIIEKVIVENKIYLHAEEDTLKVLEWIEKNSNLDFAGYFMNGGRIFKDGVEVHDLDFSLPTSAYTKPNEYGQYDDLSSSVQKVQEVITDLQQKYPFLHIEGLSFDGQIIFLNLPGAAEDITLEELYRFKES